MDPVLIDSFFPRVNGEDFKGGFIRENKIYAFFGNIAILPGAENLFHHNNRNVYA